MNNNVQKICVKKMCANTSERHVKTLCGTFDLPRIWKSDMTLTFQHLSIPVFE